MLGLLTEEPLHGYDLLERFRSRSMALWTEVGRASVYQALERLERLGFVSGKAQEGTDGPGRRVHRVTRTGHARLTAGLAERVGEVAPYETEAGLALGFSHLLPAAEARRASATREQAVRELVTAIKVERARVAAERGAARAVSNAMLDRQEALAKAELAWLKGFRASLGKGRR